MAGNHGAIIIRKKREKEAAYIVRRPRKLEVIVWVKYIRKHI